MDAVNILVFLFRSHDVFYWGSRFQFGIYGSCYMIVGELHTLDYNYGIELLHCNIKGIHLDKFDIFEISGKLKI